MSVFLCSANHISAIATWAERVGKLDRCNTALVLATANLESIQAYSGDSQAEACRRFVDAELDEFLAECQAASPMPLLPSGLRRELSPRQVAQLCECLDYQSCHAPEWSGSEANRLLVSITALALDLRTETGNRGERLWSI